MKRIAFLTLAICSFVGLSVLGVLSGNAGALDDDAESVEANASATPEPELTVTEALIAREIVRLDGDWEVPWEPRLVGFLGNKFESKHYEMLTHLPTVTSFMVAEGVLDNFSLTCLSRVTELRFLDIQYSQVTAESFSLLRSNRNLQRLSFDGVSLPAGAVAEIAKLTQIEELSFSDVEFNEGVVESLSSMQNLKHIHIFSCDGIEQEDIAVIEAALPNLE